jgi:hypothetical protein
VQQKKPPKAAIQITKENAALVRVGCFLTMCFVFLMISMPFAGYRFTFDAGIPEEFNTMILVMGLICITALGWRILYNWTEKP